MYRFRILFFPAIFLAGIGCDLMQEDTTPPQVSISSPVTGSTVRDTVLIKALAADDEGIQSVAFFVDGELLATVESEPYETEWITNDYSNGLHQLQCKATDDSDNEALSESIDVTVANSLFMANFTSNWLQLYDGNKIIFISDSAGNVLGEETFLLDNTVEILPDEDVTTVPDEISVTTVSRNDYDWGTYVNITTNHRIPVGTSWTWKGPKVFIDWGNPEGNVDLNFLSVPDHSGFIISSLWNLRRSYSWTLGSSLTFDLYESPVDLFMRVNTIDDGPAYRWLDDAQANNSYEVDLSSLESLSSSQVTLSDVMADGYVWSYGYPEPGNRYEGRYNFDYQRLRDTVLTTLDVYYPPTGFTDFRTGILFFEDLDNLGFNDSWYQATYGAIPGAFEKIDADFDFISQTPDEFQILTSGEFDQIFSYWSYDDDNNNMRYRWLVYAPADLDSYSLPDLPMGVLQEYPGIDESLFELSFAQLNDHSELTSYQEILEILFESPDYFYDVVSEYRDRRKAPESSMVRTDLKSSIDLEREVY